MASDIKTAVTRVSLPVGSAGLFNIKASVTWTPKAALFIITTAITDDTAANHATWGIGATDGVKQWAITQRSSHSKAFINDVDGRGTTTECGLVQNFNNINIDGKFEFDSFIGAGVIVNITNAFSGAFFVTAAFFGGDDLNVDVDTFSVAGAGNTNVENPGFQPDLIIFGAALQRVSGRSLLLFKFDDINRADLHINVGFCARDSADVSALTQGSINMNEQAGAPGLPVNVVSDAVIARRTQDGALFTASAVDALGFTVANSGTDSHELGYLALEVGDRKVWVDNYTTPTGTGGESSTDPTFKPQFMLHLMSQVATLNANQNTAATGAGPLGLMMIGPTQDAESVIRTYSTSVAIEDTGSANLTNTQSLSDDAVDLPDEDGTQGIEGTFTSFDATGWTVDYTAVKGTGRQWLGLAIEETGAAGPTAQAVLGSQPSATGLLFGRYLSFFQANVGSQPAATGVLTTLVQQQALVGSQATATATLTGRYNKKPQAVAGTQADISGLLTGRYNKFLQALLGSQPTATGTLTTQVIEALVVIATGVHTQDGVLFISKQPVFLLGSQPAATGLMVTKITAGFRVVVGSQPTATGSLATEFQPSRAILGSQPNATGVLGTQLISGAFSAVDEITEQFDSDAVPSGYQVRWEAHIKVNVAGAYRVRVFNITTNSEIGLSILTATGTAITREITADLFPGGGLTNLIAGVPNEYRVEQNQTQGAGTIASSHFITEPL